jgi:hypothetical protein
MPTEDTIDVSRMLYFPYTSPRGRDTILRALLLYEEVGVISPKDFFLASDMGRLPSSTNLEKVLSECNDYGRDPIFIIDPKTLIQENEDVFTEAVISDLKNPAFVANAPRGTMQLYADKLTRKLFEEFRERIKSSIALPLIRVAYREGPYSGREHFLWPVEEPMAHSILLNLALLGSSKERAVLLTDSLASHRAFLFKISGTNRVYDAHVVARELMQMAMPDISGMNVRSILDFRDNHKDDRTRFWKALQSIQDELADQFDHGSNDLLFEARIELENMKRSIKSAASSLKWTIASSVLGLTLGFSGSDPRAVVGGIGTAILAATQFAIGRRKNMNGLGYLLKVEELKD